MGVSERSADAPRETVVLDPDISRFVEATASASLLDLDAMPLEEALSLVRRPLVYPPPPPNSEDRQVVADSGRELRIRLYYPENRRADLPVLMHLHGGGFVGGTIELDDARCARLADNVGCLVVSVDYPLAPEHPFPEPIEDAFSVWTWLAACASEIGGDARRMAVSGSSAGGHLAIGVCLLARDRRAPMPALQLLTYPVVDPSLDTGSYRSFAQGPFLTHARMAWFWKQYIGSDRPDGQLCSPLTGSLAGLPPACVVTAEYDVLRDEGEAYAAALSRAGVEASLRRHDGMVHGFIAVVPDHAETALALSNCAAALKRAFAGVAA